jgi:hypothetical protein
MPPPGQMALAMNTGCSPRLPSWLLFSTLHQRQVDRHPRRRYAETPWKAKRGFLPLRAPLEFRLIEAESLRAPRVSGRFGNGSRYRLHHLGQNRTRQGVLNRENSTGISDADAISSNTRTARDTAVRNCDRSAYVNSENKACKPHLASKRILRPRWIAVGVVQVTATSVITLGRTPHRRAPGAR